MPPRRRPKPDKKEDTAIEDNEKDAIVTRQQQQQQQTQTQNYTAESNPHNNHRSSSNSSNNDNNNTTNDLTVVEVFDPTVCLHCHEAATASTATGTTATNTAGSSSSDNNNNVQVRCDECNAFICNTCHWCHEFQANHEIRVCDRCDAFYCKSCDEMDQCDDCGEVVCATCSTLLSCKFCGGGLCEDCATACGRYVIFQNEFSCSIGMLCVEKLIPYPFLIVSCGIVLCSRDAKFAVDCDTCRLSYCLVCLASGSKEPCVRCGHRPSKRMEQLVHLRLKSIYKAFKQSSNSAANSANTMNSNNSCGGTTNNGNDGSKNHANRNSNGSASAHTIHSPLRPAANQRERQNDDPNESHVADDPEILLQAAACAAKNTGAPRDRRSDRHKSGDPSHHSFHNANGTSNSSSPNGAAGSPKNAAAAARRQFKKETMEEKMEKYKAEKAKADAAAAALLAELEEEEVAAKSKKSKKKKKKERAAMKLKDDGDETGTVDEGPESKKADDADFGSRNDQLSNIEHLHEDGESADEKKEVIIKAESTSIASDQVMDVYNTISAESIANEFSAHEYSKKGKPDLLEEELAELIDNSDADGLEQYLTSIKGVPGRAMLRKNAKKALKRLRAVEKEFDLAEEQQEQQETDEGFVKSRSNIGTPVRSSKQKGPSGSTYTERVMDIAPFMVGWVIGKGGQRIQDLMHECGCRIWIDEEIMTNAAGETSRTVHMSGQTKNVDLAFEKVLEIVTKAPTVNSDGVAKSQRSPAAATKNARLTPKPVGNKPSRLSETPGQNATAISDLNPQARVPDPELLPPKTRSISMGGKSEHVMTCDPRFVPLLIGRRGWTIKNIQDTSGARVDIDQSVTPRKITVSGKEENVSLAVKMVSDVLSYPHAQLQGGAAPQLHDEENDAMDLIDIALEKEDFDDAPVKISPAEQPVEQEDHGSGMENVHSSPPSSLIMTGDAKDTISASSSLSSTPEPSMASSSTKGNYSQIPGGPMIPPLFGLGQSNGGQSELTPTNTFNRASQAPLAPAVTPGLFSPHPLPGPTNGFYNNASQAAGGMHYSQMSMQPQSVTILSKGPATRQSSQQQPLTMVQHGTAGLPHQSPGVFASIPCASPLPVNHQSAFQPSQSSFSFSSSGHPEQSILHKSNNGSITASNAWHHPPSRPPQVTPGAAKTYASPGSDAYRLEAAVEFLQHSSQARPVPLSGGVHEAIGLPTALPAVVPPLLPDRSSANAGGMLGPDESQIVDSLFAPSHSATNETSLLGSLQGLSINKPGLSSAGLWGAPGVTGDSLPALSSLAKVHTADSLKNSAHFYGASTDQHPSHSRFAWGGFLDKQPSI